ncbi:MAG: hypothetical protein ABJG15_02355 [Hyphomonadaceae bacterium]
MDKSDQHSLLMKVGDLGKVSENEARALLDEVSEDGIVSKSEAEAVFAINRQLDEAFPDWDLRFRTVLKDYLLTAEAPIGWMDEHECAWLIGQIAPYSDSVKLNEADLLLDLLPHAEGDPLGVVKCAFAAIIDISIRNGRVGRDLVERLRALLLAGADREIAWITQWEAQGLLRINESVGFARNDESWNHLYSRSMANHLMARAHPDPEIMAEALDRTKWLVAPDEAELGGMYLLGIQSADSGNWFEGFAPSGSTAKLAHETARQLADQTGISENEDEDWLINRLGWGNTITSADRTLIRFLKDETPGFSLGMALATGDYQVGSATAFS